MDIIIEIEGAPRGTYTRVSALLRRVTKGEVRIHYSKVEGFRLSVEADQLKAIGEGLAKIPGARLADVQGAPQPDPPSESLQPDAVILPSGKVAETEKPPKPTGAPVFDFSALEKAGIQVAPLDGGIPLPTVTPGQSPSTAPSPRRGTPALLTSKGPASSGTVIPLAPLIPADPKERVGYFRKRGPGKKKKGLIHRVRFSIQGIRYEMKWTLHPELGRTWDTRAITPEGFKVLGYPKTWDEVMDLVEEHVEKKETGA